MGVYRHKKKYGASAITTKFTYVLINIFINIFLSLIYSTIINIYIYYLSCTDTHVVHYLTIHLFYVKVNRPVYIYIFCH